MFLTGGAHGPPVSTNMAAWACQRGVGRFRWPRPACRRARCAHRRRDVLPELLLHAAHVCACGGGGELAERRPRAEVTRAGWQSGGGGSCRSERRPGAQRASVRVVTDLEIARLGGSYADQCVDGMVGGGMVEVLEEYFGIDLIHAGNRIWPRIDMIQNFCSFDAIFMTSTCEPKTVANNVLPTKKKSRSNSV